MQRRPCGKPGDVIIDWNGYPGRQGVVNKPGLASGTDDGLLSHIDKIKYDEYEIKIENIEAIFISSCEADEDILKGQVLYRKNNNKLGKAQAITGKHNIVGLAIESQTMGFSCQYQTKGLLTLVDWSNVTGSNLLTPGIYYFLSSTDPGKLATSPPTESGCYNKKIGFSHNTQTLEIINCFSVLL